MATIPGRASRSSPESEAGPRPPGVKGRAGERYQEKHHHIRGRGLISSSALGLSDGLVTNLAFLTGFAGAVDTVGLIRFAGIAAMLAGTVSMFFGGILGARSELDLFHADARREAFEIENEREEEVQELKTLYRDKGLTEAEAEMVVARVSADKERFLEDMLANELHIHRSHLEKPYKVGLVIGLSFLLGSSVPLVPYYLGTDKTLSAVASVASSLAFLFAAGAWKGRIVDRNALRSGLETLMVGAVAAAILFAIGSASTFV
ncbi:MAG: VIT1/CCC1 transporter family protein [Nitrososphaerales archaeon]|jgi:predicted membrane protein (TIGR00267 family)